MESGDVLVGFRPQSLSLGEEAEEPLFDLELTFLEPIDDRALARLEGPEGEMRALVPSRQSLEENQTVPVDLDTNKLFIFDAQTEELVATSGTAPTEEISQSINVD